MSVGPLTYEQAIARLGEAQRFGINPSLEGIRALTIALGTPQDTFQCVQITGTNGKTSAARVAAATLRATGFRVGLYTSPHLVSYTERVEIDGVPVSERAMAEALSVAFKVADSLGMRFTEFELLTAAAFALFRLEGVEWAVLEVGMGGTWDATSVVSPAVAAITGVGLDHTDRLGATREQIAADKAGIIVHGCTAVIGPGCVGVEDIFRERARSVGANVVRIAEHDADVTFSILRRPRRPNGTLTVRVDAARRLGPFTLDAPSYQAPNVAVGVIAAGVATWELFDVPALRSELRTLTFPGRFELLRKTPPLVIDGAHNPQAAGVLATAIDEAFGKEPPVIVLAILADKDAEGIVRALAPVASAFVVSQNDSPRCLSAAELAVVVERVTGSSPIVKQDLSEALRAADALGGGVVVTGSLYTAGAVRALFMR